MTINIRRYANIIADLNNEITPSKPWPPVEETTETLAMGNPYPDPNEEKVQEKISQREKELEEKESRLKKEQEILKAEQEKLEEERKRIEVERRTLDAEILEHSDIGETL